MGKALVIEGLQVSNPLCVITIGENTPERVLANYLSVNKSISESEKTALKVMVGTFIDNKLWSKIKVLLPICGSSASDMLIDAVNPGETIIADASRYSVDDNKLKFASQYNSTDKGTFANEISTNNLSIYYGYKRLSTGNSRAMSLDTIDSQSIYLEATEGGIRQPTLTVNGTQIRASTALLVDNRIICAKIESSSAYLYCNNQLLAEGSCSINEDKLSTITNFSVCSSVDMWATFMCMANGLTSDEEAIMYNAIDTFLTTIGKRD